MHQVDRRGVRSPSLRARRQTRCAFRAASAPAGLHPNQHRASFGEAAARLPSWRFSLDRTSFKSVEILPRESGEWQGKKKKKYKYLLSIFAFKSGRFRPIGREVGVLTCCEPASSV